MANRRRWRRGRLALVIAVGVAAACGGDKATGPVPCDTYHGGTIGSATLPGTYDLKSFCQGMKPNVAGASGTVTITATDFTADVTIQGTTTTYSGTYVTSSPDGITVNLTSPLPATFVGNYRVTTDSLYVSGAVGTEKFAFIGTRAP